MGKILVTCVGTEVGRNVYELLKEAGEDVVGAVKSISSEKGNFPDAADLVELDYLNTNTFNKALENIEKVFLIRPSKIREPYHLYPFIDKLKGKGIKFVVFLSLIGVDKYTIPAESKLEKYIEKALLTHCHVRANFFMDIFTKVHAKEIKDNSEIYTYMGRNACSFISAKDVAYAVSRILQESEKYAETAFHLTGNESLSGFDIADILSDVLEKRVTYSALSLLKFRKYMIKTMGIDKKQVNIMMALYFIIRLRLSEPVTDDFEKITGKQTKTFKEFAKENINVWK